MSIQPVKQTLRLPGTAGNEVAFELPVQSHRGYDQTLGGVMLVYRRTHGDVFAFDRAIGVALRGKPFFRPFSQLKLEDYNGYEMVFAYEQDGVTCMAAGVVHNGMVAIGKRFFLRTGQSVDHRAKITHFSTEVPEACRMRNVLED